MANPHRLPRTILPRRYALDLTPDLEAATFEGSVDIDIEVGEATHEVVLNAVELEVDEAWVTTGGRRIEASVTLDDESERATLTLDEEVPLGAPTIYRNIRRWLSSIGIELGAQGAVPARGVKPVEAPPTPESAVVA